jgi:putative addiction module killer protein
MGYYKSMIEIRRTPEFLDFLAGLRDVRARTMIVSRLDRLSQGNPGDVAPVGEGVSELRLHYGPGYRVYYVRRGEVLIVVLCGGDKSSQDRDVKRAKELARNLEE